VVIGLGLMVVVVLVVAFAVRSSGDAAQLISGLFRPPGLGWPSGVQEDDDAHWTWDPHPTDADRVPAKPMAPTASPGDPADPVEVVPVRSRISRP
jgi:hypothetical protein